MKRYLLIITLLLAQVATRAQDPLFSQFFYSPAYLNPAFTGVAKYDFRATLSSRLQWMNLQTPYKYVTLSADQYIRPAEGGIGLTFNHFEEGYIRTDQVYANLAKSFGPSENCDPWFVNFAFQLGFGASNADRSKLIFPDQTDITGLNGSATQAELFRYAGKPYFDITFGFLFCYSNFMIGAAAHHMNEPMNGLIGSVDNSRLPRRYTFHASYVNPDALKNNGAVIIRPTLIYNLQRDSRDLMAGFTIGCADWPVEFNGWYRNSFGASGASGVPSYNSLSIGVNIKFSKDRGLNMSDPNYRLNAGANYEGELSRPGIRYTNGSTELGMLYEANWTGDNCPKDIRGSCQVYYPWVFLQ